MNRQQSPTITVKRPGARNELETRLHGRWLWLARIGWITLGVLSVIFVVAGFPLEFQYYQTIGNMCAPSPQFTSQQARELRAMGLSLGFYAGYLLAFELLCKFGRS